ncbi:hypothetical protein GCM10022397_11460 [Flavivirga jejuensis]
MSFNSLIHLSAALQGPKVCELDGPTPIFNMSKTEIHSINFVIAIVSSNITFQRIFFNFICKVYEKCIMIKEIKVYGRFPLIYVLNKMFF